ncbi:MAG: hypothetical protein NC489_41575 [Ruminococcus flavefaciens]|nr:hypothetical protein [Ruminococcus flavefaciens]
MNILTTREWATLLWGVLLMLWMLSHKNIRDSLKVVIKTFFNDKLRILWEIIFLYVLIVTIIFSHLPFWKIVYIKDVLIWFVFSGLIFCMNAVSRESDEGYVRKNLKENLKITIFAEFFISTFTFNIWIELAIIPIITIIMMMDVIAERDKKYQAVHKLLKAILAIFGCCILFGTIKVCVEEYSELNISDTFISFMIPIVYLFLIVPLEYTLELYSKYELLFMRMSFKESEDKKIQRSHRWQIVRISKLSVYRVLLFQRKFCCRMYSRMSGNEFLDLLEEFKRECKKNK